MQQTTLAAAAALLGDAVEQVGAPLPTSARNRVVRLRTSAGRTVIAKHYLDDSTDGRWRELAALRTLGDTDSAPHLLAASDDVAILEDLGEHPHLASWLLADDADLGAEKLHAWARALGTFHRDGLAAADAFEHEFRSHTGSSSDYMTEQLEESAHEWAQLAGRLGVELHGDFEELAQVPRRFRTPLLTVSPGDACPDNNVDVSDTVRLIDLEFASVRHAAWDVAYLVVPWPTCWCAWTLPDPTVGDALTAWCTGAGVPESADLVHDLELAAHAWHWLSAGWLLTGLLAQTYGARPDRPSPRAQDRIARSLEVLAASEVFPDLTDDATELLLGLRRIYDVEPLPPMPAFR